MQNSDGTIRVAFHGADDFLISSEKLQMTDAELRDYLDTVIDGGWPEPIRRVTLYSRTRPFRRITVDRRPAFNEGDVVAAA